MTEDHNQNFLSNSRFDLLPGAESLYENSLHATSDCLDTFMSNLTAMKMDEMSGEEHPYKDTPLPESSDKPEEQESARVHPQETSVMVFRDGFVSSEEKDTGMKTRDIESDSFHKVTSAMITKFINHFRYGGQLRASLLKARESEDKHVSEASGKDGLGLRSITEDRPHSFDGNGSQDSGVMEMKVPSTSRTTADSGQNAFEEAPRKFRTIPGPHFIKPSPVRAKRIYVESDGEASFENIEEYEPVWLHRFVAELNKAHKERATKSGEECLLSIRCNQEHNFSLCDVSVDEKDDIFVPKRIAESSQQNALSNDPSECAKYVGQDGIQQATRMAQSSAQDASNVTSHRKGTRYLRFKDEFDESMTTIVCENSHHPSVATTR